MLVGVRLYILCVQISFLMASERPGPVFGPWTAGSRRPVRKGEAPVIAPGQPPVNPLGAPVRGRHLPRGARARTSWSSGGARKAPGSGRWIQAPGARKSPLEAILPHTIGLNTPSSINRALPTISGYPRPSAMSARTGPRPSVNGRIFPGAGHMWGSEKPGHP